MFTRLTGTEPKLTKTENRGLVAALIASYLMLFNGCVTASQQEKLNSEEQQLYSDINEIVGDKACSTTAECGIIPLGSLPCGGPSSYMAYALSIGDDEISKLKALAEQSKELGKKQNQLSKMMSPCVYHSAPVPICQNKQCASSYEETSKLGDLPRDVK